MSEQLEDLRELEKSAAYRILAQQAQAVLAGITDPIAQMSTLSCLIHGGFGHLWTGFYRVVAPSLLRVGPYQGSLGCLEIAFGRGVCGTAAATGKTVIVPDVNAFSGHISCDNRSRSEIVVPVKNRNGELIAVLDIDSEKLASFDAQDAAALEAIVDTIFAA